MNKLKDIEKAAKVSGADDFIEKLKMVMTHYFKRNGIMEVNYRLTMAKNSNISCGS